MRPDDILETLRQQPFEPFRLYLSDGTAYDIRHPDFVRVGRSKLLVFAPAAEQPGVFEKYDTVSLLHITRLESLNPPVTRTAGP